MSRHTVPPAPCIAYGEHPDQVANLHLPAREGGPWPCVVLLHGGFWRTGWDRTLMTPLAFDLAARGIAAWNVEYRRVGQEGGGWPGTLEDVAAAVDRLADVDEVDAARVVTCGHSAGGHLALWLAARPRIPGGMPGADPRVTPVAAVAQAGVCDLERARRDDLGGGAVEGLLGPPDDQRATPPHRPLRSRRSASRSSSSTATRTTSCPCRRAGTTPRSTPTRSSSSSRASTTSR